MGIPELIFALSVAQSSRTAVRSSEKRKKAGQQADELRRNLAAEKDADARARDALSSIDQLRARKRRTARRQLRIEPSSPVAGLAGTGGGGTGLGGVVTGLRV